MTLKIYGKSCPIRKIDGLIQSHGWNGYFDLDKFAIYIDSSIENNSEEYWEVLLHEVTHAIFLRMALYQTKIPAEIEEIICQILSVALCENFKVAFKNAKSKTKKS